MHVMEESTNLHQVRTHEQSKWLIQFEVLYAMSYQIPLDLLQIYDLSAHTTTPVRPYLYSNQYISQGVGFFPLCPVLQKV